MKKILIKSKKNGKYLKSRITIKKEIVEDIPLQDYNLDTSVNVISNKGLDDNSQNISFLEEKKRIALDLLQKSENLKTDENVLMINSDSLGNLLEKKTITIRWCKLCNLIVRSVS